MMIAYMLAAGHGSFDYKWYEIHANGNIMLAFNFIIITTSMK
jgi:hypothetical protein